MPGIWGLCHEREHDGDAGVASSMARALRHSNLYQESAVVSHGFRAGAITLPEVRNPVFSDPAGDLPCVLIDGEIYDAEARRQELQRRGAVFRTASISELLAQGWRLLGPAFLERVDGYFSAAIWDPPHQRLTLVTDRFGMRPLYYSHRNGGLIFASEIKALLQYPGMQPSASLKGIAQFLTFGHLFGDDTLLDGVFIAPAAAELVYLPQAGTLTTRVYPRLQQGEPIRSERDALVLLDEAFGRAVTRRIAGDLPLGLSLSGGLDARTILATVPAQVALKTVSLGIPGSIDHRAAARLSRLSGHQHHSHHLDRNFLDNFPRHLERLTFLTDGQYLDQAITVPTLGIYRELGIGALLRGHAGELFHMDKAYAFSIAGSELGFASLAAVERWLWEHLTPYMTANVGSDLFRRAVRSDAEQAARAALHAAVQQASDVTPPDQAIWHLFVSQRLRRETALSMQMFNAFVQVRMPYLDAELVDLVMRVPPQLKVGETIQAFILGHRFPEFLNVVNANTGSPLGAGPLTRRLSLLRLKVFSKLRVPGYQPYERLGLWLSQELQPFVKSVLLAPKALDRGLLEPDVVRRMIEDHRSRRRNHTFALMAMLILELGQSQLEDPIRARQAVEQVGT